MADARGLLLQWTPESQAFWFDAGAVCLELLTTGGELPWGHVESLHTPADLRAWAKASRLDVEDLDVDEAGLNELRTLRDTVWKVAKALIDGQDLTQADLDTLNELAVVSAVPQVDAGLRRGWRTPVTASEFTGAIARDTIELMTGLHADRVRRCEGDNCELMFVDTSRPGKRRWCSMQRCGNRAKIREFRDRQRTEGAAR